MASHSSQGQSPRDAKIIALMLSSAGVDEYEPKVVQQLLEFAHTSIGYSVDVLQDALIYSEHAGRINDLDLDDVKLAIQGRVNHSFTSPPSKEFLVELAREVNKERLPNIPEKYGLRLPPEHYCMTAVNFQLIPEDQAAIERSFKQEDDDYDEDDGVRNNNNINDDGIDEDDNNEDNVILKFDLPSSSFSSFAQQSPTTLPLQNLSNNDELFSQVNEDYEMQESTTQSTVTSPATEGYKRPRNEEDDNYDF
ncbi:12752_t:CDS:2 [Ambispora leptoticha]|uniref:12752_t:CDS:1 n=1 Tax=Ambispora leptoticha TaxID=144679 RepID=A0A9N9B7V5_9GLOM|nr:12752_t:CDS:2 [Ambispora leptoticha]